MPSVQRRFSTIAAPHTVYAYLADFTNTEGWDPGTTRCDRLSGDGGVGTRYRNVSRFLGRTVEVEYVAEELEPGEFVHFVGRNDSFTGHDRIGIEPDADGEGSRLHYAAEFQFKGLSRIAAPAVALYLPRLADQTVAQMRERLDALR